MNALRITTSALRSAQRQPIQQGTAGSPARTEQPDEAAQPGRAASAEQQALLTAHAAALGILGFLCVP
jgi:hypothetical protein